jgi:hypothetical protein
VDNAVLVGVVHGPGQRLDKLGRPPRRLRDASEVLLQVAAVHELQRQEGPAPGRAHLEDLHDVRVLQPGDDLRLGAEAGQLLRVGVRARQDFQGHQAGQPVLPGLEDDAHAAAAQLAEQLVPRHRRPPRRTPRGRHARRSPPFGHPPLRQVRGERFGAPGRGQGQVQLNLRPERDGVLREAPQELLQARLFALLFRSRNSL